MHRVDGRLDLVRARLAATQAPPDQDVSLGDQVAIPQRAVLVGEPDEFPGLGRPGRPARLDQQHQREQAEDLWLVRHQAGEEPAEPDRLGREILPGEPAARGRRVALVEDQVNHREDRRDSVGQVGPGGYAVGDPRVPDLAFRPDQPLSHRRLGDEERAGDLRGAQAAEQPERQRDLRLPRERGVAAGEDQPQPVILHGVLLGLALLGRFARRPAAPRPGPACPHVRPHGGGGRWPGSAPS